MEIIFLKIRNVVEEKKTTTTTKPNTLLLHMPHGNGGDDNVGIKRPIWKPKVGYARHHRMHRPKTTRKQHATRFAV